ncbi:MAG TPA: hypothetical protein VK817_24220 [Trebonia sp.]|nr:hypothetical protein [Trebonia sp.]
MVWLTLGTAPRQVSIQSAASRLLSEQRPCHLIWDPATGEIAQLISALRAGRALGAPEHLGWHSPGEFVTEVNNEGRICLQIGVLAHPAEPFTNGPMAGIGVIVGWLDSWGIPRRWPAGKPSYHGSHLRDRALWARGGHFGASQVPGCESTGPGEIDIDRLTGSHLHQVRPVTTPSALPISA